MVDECRDASSKEQMAIALRYVYNDYVIERFIGIVHVTSTTSLSLKEAIVSTLMKHQLSMSRIRGQGYDGASNMRGEFNGLKTLILNDNSFAYYVHYFAHQLQLINICILFSSIRDVLDFVIDDGGSPEQKADALLLSIWAESFDCAFGIIPMKKILRITSELSQVLQIKDQDIVNAIKLVRVAKQRLENMRNHEWTSFVNEVSLFCNKINILIPRMDDEYVAPGRSCRRTHKVTNLFHYEIEIFKTVIDWMLQELNTRFNEVSTQLLGCMACLSLDNSFSSFDKAKLVRLAEFYPHDFSKTDCDVLEDQLETYLLDMKSSTEYKDLKGVGSLAAKLVETNNNFVFPLVYRLIKLVLLLHVSTTSV